MSTRNYLYKYDESILKQSNIKKRPDGWLEQSAHRRGWPPRKKDVLC